jgi:hypothetical protein
MNVPQNPTQRPSLDSPERQQHHARRRAAAEQIITRERADAGASAIEIARWLRAELDSPDAFAVSAARPHTEIVEVSDVLE